MTSRTSLPHDKLLLTLLGGAALGALAVAFTTPRTGREVRRKFRAIGDLLRGHTRMAEDDLIEAMFI